MKKYLFIVAAVLFLISCGSGTKKLSEAEIIMLAQTYVQSNGYTATRSKVDESKIEVKDGMSIEEVLDSRFNTIQSSPEFIEKTDDDALLIHFMGVSDSTVSLSVKVSLDGETVEEHVYQ